VLNLADVLPARLYFAVSALLAAAVNALLITSPGYAPALALRFLTGFFLAGVYPPAMKMLATRFQSGRGLAIGTIVGALTLGKASPYLMRAFEGADLAAVVLTASTGAVTAALLVATAYTDGPFAFARRPFSWRLVGTVARHRPTRLAIAGYLGHMWEVCARYRPMRFLSCQRLCAWRSPQNCFACLRANLRDKKDQGDLNRFQRLSVDVQGVAAPCRPIVVSVISVDPRESIQRHYSRRRS
jgi:hypothetical protein